MLRNTILGELPKLVDGVAGNILSYALLLAAVATIAMAFLELIKALFKLRYYFHSSRVKKWINSQSVFEQLVVLAVGDKDAQQALFDQPTDKLMAQVQAVANIVVDFPATYPELYHFFASNPLDKENENPDTKIWKNFIEQPALVSGANDQLTRDATKARASIDHFVSRRLDAFQTLTEYVWARWNQYFSVATSTVFLVFLLTGIQVPLQWAITLALFGGMMAPFAKDVVTALSGLKTK